MLHGAIRLFPGVHTRLEYRFRLFRKQHLQPMGCSGLKKRGQFKYKGKYTPKRCDIVYFKTGRSHVGIVESVSGGQLHTIEGNTSDKVARRSYSLNNATITGYGTPKYTSTQNGSSGSGKKDSKKGTAIFAENIIAS